MRSSRAFLLASDSCGTSSSEEEGLGPEDYARPRFPLSARGDIVQLRGKRYPIPKRKVLASRTSHSTTTATANKKKKVSAAATTSSSSLTGGTSTRGKRGRGLPDTSSDDDEAFTSDSEEVGNKKKKKIFVRTTEQEQPAAGRKSKTTSTSIKKKKKKSVAPVVARKLIVDDSSSGDDGSSSEEEDTNPLPKSAIHSTRASQHQQLLSSIPGIEEESTSLHGTHHRRHIQYDALRAEIPLLSTTDVSLSFMLEAERSTTEGRISASNILQESFMWDRENSNLIMGILDHEDDHGDLRGATQGEKKPTAAENGDQEGEFDLMSSPCLRRQSTAENTKKQQRKSTAKKNSSAPLAFSTPLMCGSEANERSSTFGALGGYTEPAATSLAGLVTRGSTGGSRLSGGGLYDDPSTAPRQSMIFTPEEQEAMRRQEEDIEEGNGGSDDLPGLLRARRSKSRGEEEEEEKETETSPLFQRACETRSTVSRPVVDYSEAMSTRNKDGSTNWDKVIKQCSGPVPKFMCVMPVDHSDGRHGGSFGGEISLGQLPGGCQQQQYSSGATTAGVSPENSTPEAEEVNEEEDDWMAAMSAAMNLPSVTGAASSAAELCSSGFF